MTSLPEPRAGQKKLGLVIDLDICVGCHACATACKEWNASGHMGPLPDLEPYGDGAWGVWFNRIHSFEEGEGDGSRTIHFPKSCLHCEQPACVTVCPTGASYKRADDGIVLVNEAICIGCKLCSWACPYGAREFDQDAGVMKKCTLCIDRIYNANLEPEDRLPACVMVCPVSARHFGDLADPQSDVSQMVARRGHADLMIIGQQPDEEGGHGHGQDRNGEHRLTAEAVANVPGWPARPLTMPDLQCRTTLREQDLPVSFGEDLRRHLEWATGADPLAEPAPPKALAPRTLRLRRTQLLLAASRLVELANGTVRQSACNSDARD